ncbi:hypothetical protein RGR08_11380 [Staphylococcus epidermidis]|uniref:hypothetical protein n=1 Tax=Staphylococcus epidermidis TaxID=1282 RepID=UPI003F884B4A
MTYSYEVVREFADANTQKKYIVGSDYPTDISSERINQLLHKENKYNQQYIKLVVDDKNTKEDLIDIANKHNIQISEKDKKADILKALEG